MVEELRKKIAMLQSEYEKNLQTLCLEYGEKGMYVERVVIKSVDDAEIDGSFTVTMNYSRDIFDED